MRERTLPGGVGLRLLPKKEGEEQAGGEEEEEVPKNFCGTGE